MHLKYLNFQESSNDISSKHDYLFCHNERKSIYIGEDRYIGDMEIDATLERKLRQIVDERFEKLFLKNDEILNSSKYLVLSKPIKKDKNAFEKLIKMRERKTKFLSKEEYIKTMNEE
jgi:hypothetical protein